MDKARIEEYHATRDFSDKGFRSACYAPHVSMYFDTLGNVLACCQNAKYPMGNVAKERLGEIWHGDRARKLRRALQKDSFGAGCQFCEWQISVGNYLNAFTRNFDSYPVPSENPEWPQMMEFSVSNTCNLECVMCYGVLSSSIRARREGLPPLPKAYGPQFFEDLRPFLHHLKFAKFLGGEPFLAAESFQIWDLMHEENVSFPCNVTTNGTQWNPKVEEVLERFPISVCISMDGATKETVESIRVNAKFDTVQENFRHFHAYCRGRGTPLVLTYCLMPQNWHEFGAYLLFAEEWGCTVGVNLVYEPAHCSLYTLPTRELDRIATAMEKEGERILPQLKLNRNLWIEQVTAIRRRVDNATESARSPFQTPLSLVVLNNSEVESKVRNMPIEEATARLQDAVGKETPIVHFASDKDDRIESIDALDTFFDLPVEECIGKPFAEVVESLAKRHGTLRSVPIYVSYDFIERCLLFQRPSGELWCIRQISVPRTNEFGMTHGSMAVAASFVIHPENLTFDEGKIRSTLMEWSPGTVVETMFLDAAGGLIEIPVAGDNLEGLPANLAVGTTDTEFLLACRQTWGLAENIRSLVGADFEDHTYRFDRKTGLLILRYFTIPRFDPAGAHTGYQRFVSVSLLDAAKMADVETKARKQLAEWSGHERVLRLACNRGEEAIAVESPAGGLLGLEESSCLGKTQQQILDDLTRRFGKRTNDFYEQKLDHKDLIDTYNTPSGHVAIRYISFPRFNTAGHHVGTIRLYSGIHVGRSEAIDAENEARKTLEAWAENSSRLLLIENEDGSVERAAFERPTFFGLNVDSLVKQNHEEVQQQLVEQFGLMSFRYYVRKAHVVDMILDYAKPGSLLQARVCRFAHVDIDGFCQGHVAMIAAHLSDAVSSAASERRRRAELDEWDRDAQVYRIFENRERKIVDVQGSPSVLGIQLRDFYGRSMDDLAVEVERRTGARQVTSWQQTAEGVELTAEMSGNQLRVSIRCVTLPCVPSAESEPGYVHLLAVKAVKETNLMERLDQMAGDLKQWAGSNHFMCVVEDEFSRILEVDADVPEFLGVTVATLPSRGMPSVTADVEGKFGHPTVRYDRVSPGEIDVALFYEPPGELISVRSIMLPSPLQNRTVGAIRLIVARHYSSLELSAEAQRARALIAAWAGSDEVLSFVTRGSEQILQWHGRDESWHGIVPSDINGKPINEFHELITQRFGTVSYKVDETATAWDDVSVTFESAEGIRRARCIVMPFMDQEGKHEGRLQIFAFAKPVGGNGSVRQVESPMVTAY